jgi:flagellar protein FlaI
VARKKKKVLLPRGTVAATASWDGARGSYLTRIPDVISESIEELEITPVKPPFTYARVIYDNEESEYLYETFEPELNPRDRELLEMVKDALARTLEYDVETFGSKDKEEYLKESVESFIRSRSLNIDKATTEKLIYFIVRDFVGYGPIDVLMSDANIEDISCDGTDVPLFIFHKKYESLKASGRFPDDEILNSFVVYLGQRCGKQISVANPILDGTTWEGHRVQAPIELIQFNTASPEMVAYLWIAMEHGKSMMCCGGTASGKTATLNAAALFIRPGAKIVSIEDTREINLPHENWIPGVTRSGVGEKGVGGKAAGEIDMFDLVRAALRQRPNYILVGEVRGRETYAQDPANGPQFRSHPEACESW